jgi:hypothetical protein
VRTVKDFVIVLSLLVAIVIGTLAIALNMQKKLHTDIPPEPELVHVIMQPLWVEDVGRMSIIDVDGVRCVTVVNGSASISCDWRTEQVERCTTDSDCMSKNGGDGGPSTEF